MFTGETKVVKCGECGSLNGIPGTQAIDGLEEKV